MNFSRISEFAAVTSYLGLAGAATILRSNPRTLAIMAAVGFAFDLIQANNRPERVDEDFADVEMGDRFDHGIPRYPDRFERDRVRYPYAGVAGARALAGGHRDEGDEWGDAAVPGRDDRAGAGHAWGGVAGAGALAGGYRDEDDGLPDAGVAYGGGVAARARFRGEGLDDLRESPRGEMGGRRVRLARRADEEEEEGQQGFFTKLKNKVSAAFHAVCAGSAWFSNKISLEKTYAYHYVTGIYRATKKFYAGFLPQEEEE